MISLTAYPALLAQVVGSDSVVRDLAARDTVVTVMVQHRDVFAWTSGILEILLLIVAVGAVAALALLFLALRKAIAKVETTMSTLTAQTRPLMERVTGIADDAREVVARLRHDADRVTDAASAVSEQLLDAAERTAERMDEVNAVLDVLQDRIEDSAIGAVSAVRGVQAAVGALASGRPTRRDRAPVLLMREGSAPDPDEMLLDYGEYDDTDEYDAYQIELAEAQAEAAIAGVGAATRRRGRGGNRTGADPA